MKLFRYGVMNYSNTRDIKNYDKYVWAHCEQGARELLEGRLDHMEVIITCKEIDLNILEDTIL